jgi:hypothetical protein
MSGLFMTSLQRSIPERTLTNLELDILCPNCGAIGEALVSGNEGLVFRVAGCREGFSAIRPSADYREAEVRCNCGQEFYLL